jgi:dihydroorotase
MTTEITIRQPDDFHLHLRDGELLERVLPFTANVFGRALVMPNLTPPVLTFNHAQNYAQRIAEVLAGGDLRKLWGQTFQPLMTIKLTDATTPEIVTKAKAKGVIAAKLYPAGVTTNSADGVADFLSDDLHAVFETMADCGMVLCLHGETPGVPSLDREEHFVKNYLIPIAQDHPTLKVVLEHVTTEIGCRIVRTLPNVAGTITVHHLLLTIDDVIGGNLNPHCFCKPVAKTEADRQALIRAATTRLGSFFLGTDSAPHLVSNKHTAHGAAGCFTAPVAMELLTQVFEEHNALENLERFTSESGAEFYGLPLNKGKIRLVKETSTVPQSFSCGDDGSDCAEGYTSGDDLIPFWAGRELQWKVAEVIHEEKEEA